MKAKGGQLKPRRFQAGIQVTGEDRSGLLRDILDALAREQCPLLSVRSHTVRELARFSLILEVPSGEVLTKVKQMVRQVRGVVSCRRM